MTKKEKAQGEAIKTLAEWGVKAGDTIYTTLDHVSRSGMSRCVGVYKFSVDKNGGVTKERLSYHVAKALDWPFCKKHEAVKVSGCGMDMGFHLVYTLGRVMFPNTGSDGGYKLKQEWI